MRSIPEPAQPEQAGPEPAASRTESDRSAEPAARRPAPLTFTRLLGGFFAEVRDRTARRLIRLGVSADLLTVAGLVLAGAAGVAFAAGTWRFRLGALLVVAAGACDMLDGAVAKTSGRSTPFGAFLDSSVDRYSDGFLFGGLLLHWAYGGEHLLAALSLSALVGSFAVSYTRARAENLIDSCKVGFWERGERTVLLLLAALFGVVPAAMVLLGTLTHLTALQRILHTRDRLQGRRCEPPREGRLRRFWWWFLHRVVLWSYPRASVPYDIAVALVILFTLLAPVPG